MARYVLASVLASVVGFGTMPSAQLQCGSAATQEQLARRGIAITTARQINTAEAQAFLAGSKYFPLALLKGVTVPEGFDVQVSTDGDTYTFSIKDAKDRCQVAVFSDQKGVIYTGLPLQ